MGPFTTTATVIIRQIKIDPKACIFRSYS